MPVFVKIDDAVSQTAGLTSAIRPETSLESSSSGLRNAQREQHIRGVSTPVLPISGQYDQRRMTLIDQFID